MSVSIRGSADREQPVGTGELRDDLRDDRGFRASFCQRGPKVPNATDGLWLT